MTLFCYRSDNLSDEQKERIIDFRNYDDNGRWYVLLDEAHKGDKEDSKRQHIYSILARNGFLFNFSATFTDERDIATTVCDFNLARFTQAGYGKHLAILQQEFRAFRDQDDYTGEEKQKIVLKSLMLLAYCMKLAERLRTKQPNLPAPRPSAGQFCVYVLKCSDGSFYIGQTEDFPRRIEQHEKQEVSWTACRLPVEPIHWEILASREEAVTREQHLKTGLGRKWLKREYAAGRLAAASRQAGLPAPSSASRQAGMYHRPLLLTLVNSVNTEDADLKRFFRELERAGKGEVADSVWQAAKKELLDELSQRPAPVFESDSVVSIQEDVLRGLKPKDMLKLVFNASSPGEIEVLVRPSNRQELAFKLKTSERPFARLRWLGGFVHRPSFSATHCPAAEANRRCTNERCTILVGRPGRED